MSLILKYTLILIISIISACGSEENSESSDNLNDELELDTIAPSEIVLINSIEGDSQATISWLNPDESDFSHTLIKYSISGLFDIGSVSTDLNEITIDELSNLNTYTFILHTVDFNNNVSNGIEVTIMPIGTVTSDSIPPIIEKFTINDTLINTSLSNNSVTGEIQVYDNLGTIDRIPYLAFSASSGALYSADLIKDDILSINGFAVYSWSVEIPQSAPVGTYEVLTLQVRDNVGNQKNYTSNDLTDLGFNTTFEGI